MPGPDLSFVIAHRGASGTAPENTRAAVRRAHALGARWVEIDVQCARDGTPVVIHDHRMNRTTNGRGRVAEHTAEALAQFDAGAWFDSRFAGERIPTLAQMLDLCSSLGLGLNVELKPAPGAGRETARAAASLLADWPGMLLVTSFDFEALAAFHAAAPAVPVGALFGSAPSTAEVAAIGLPLSTIGVAARAASREVVAQLVGGGHAIMVYTVNAVEDAVRLRSWGVRAIFTDFPERLLTAFPG